jgi:hypothetical protein
MRHNQAARLAAVAIVWCGLVGAARAQLPQQLVSRYRPAVEKLRQAYMHATIEGTSMLAYPGQDKSREQQFVMRAGGELRRLDVTTVKQQGMGLKVGGSEMRMATPWGSLSTYTAPGSKFFDNAKQTSYGETVAEIDKVSLLNYPYALDASGTILDMLLNGGVQVTSVKSFKSEGQQLVKISYQESASHAGRTGLWDSWLVLSPGEGWALRGFTRTLGQGTGAITQRAKLTYSDSTDGVPQVQSIEAETVAGRTPIRREAIQVSKIKFGDPDRYYFDSFSF